MPPCAPPPTLGRSADACLPCRERVQAQGAEIYTFDQVFMPAHSHVVCMPGVQYVTMRLHVERSCGRDCLPWEYFHGMAAR